ncbi:uncharacterized protein F5Z01DRAFT_747915 [Emericellopsis atlantica]|uniref:Uncharacterized protein n=1 Tax=Emericellopsis atlantica TaxID=2614577 RepID=A0A9P7ZRT5_9HYPO|nr:uncharacterized protein F5Z01DRAFT_747915 [Emericellopsis atlantica]KAG9257050.1 hypothetical protein F5Z01DRAFT_747915 [Emericellopsis atlantica]
MCTYARFVFTCSHYIQGKRVRYCPLGEAYVSGILPTDCGLEQPHGLHSRRLPRKCDECTKTDEHLHVARKKLEKCRGIFHERWPEYGDTEVCKEFRLISRAVELYDLENDEGSAVSSVSRDIHRREEIEILNAETTESPPRNSSRTAISSIPSSSGRAQSHTDATSDAGTTNSAPSTSTKTREASIRVKKPLKSRIAVPAKTSPRPLLLKAPARSKLPLPGGVLNSSTVPKKPSSIMNLLESRPRASGCSSGFGSWR